MLKQSESQSALLSPGAASLSNHVIIRASISTSLAREIIVPLTPCPSSPRRSDTQDPPRELQLGCGPSAEREQRGLAISLLIPGNQLIDDDKALE
ncbi:hypothetical protein AAFF_G00042320 [Aldrovandia affinis]|uniref:Uncharacterized protein n=1 Tax=Aldrovandia affinis TaxID=143900 RepID=A0AAD7S2R1_9TELE|nr:hypothetical protein AAFF_G00042320 [Aldrovandia affinis]